MTANSPLAGVWRRPLPGLGRWLHRLVLRVIVGLSRPWIEIYGAERLTGLPDPLIFACNHNNAYESIVVPAALIFLRGGRRIHFLVDWMFLHVPIVGWIIRQIEPIAVYNKPARWRLFESHRQAHLRESPLDACLDCLGQGHSVGIFPEGTRNRDPHTLRRARKGLGRLVLRSDVLVVPVGIDFPARHRLGRMPRIGRIRIAIGEPLDFKPQRQALRLSRAAEDRHLERRLSEEIAGRVMTALERLSTKRYPFATTGGPMRREIQTTKVLTEKDRLAAQTIIEEVYKREKRWVSDSRAEIPETIAEITTHSWFLARIGSRPAGLIRLAYDPPLELPPELEVRLEKDVDLAAIARACRFVDIGRFMILPRYRRNIRVALNLMKEAVREVVIRGYTHLLTDVFESDPHSPLHFHTRVLGFERIGTHRYGELSCESLRIILVLDLARAYHRIRLRKNKVLQELSEGLKDEFERLPLVSWA